MHDENADVTVDENALLPSALAVADATRADAIDARPSSTFASKDVRNLIMLSVATAAIVGILIALAVIAR